MLHSAGFQSLPPLPTSKLGPSGAASRVGARSRPLWVFPMSSPVRPGVSPTAASTPTGVFTQWFEALFPHAGTLGWAVCHPVHQLLPRRPAAALPTPLHSLPPCCQSSPPGCQSPPILRVWRNVSSLFLWLSDFHIVRFSISSGCFLFLNCCWPSFGCVRRPRVTTYASIVARSRKSFYI